MMIDVYRFVIRPVLTIVLFIFVMGAVLDCFAETNAVKTTEELFPDVKTPDEIFGDNGASLLAKIAKIEKLEAAINSSEDLRKVYHGGKPEHIFETNQTTKIIQRLDKYPDGYIHIEKGAARKIPTAERSANIKTMSAQIKKSRVERLRERIADLSGNTNAVAMAQLEQAKRLLERLERTSTTNYVDKVFTPEPKGARK